MAIIKTQKLRSMQAKVETWDKITLFYGQKRIVINDALVFCSYASRCAVYDPYHNIIYCLPRWDYSATTMRQFRAFIDDFTRLDPISVSEVRADLSINDTYCDYFKCDQYQDEWGTTHIY